VIGRRFVLALALLGIGVSLVLPGLAFSAREGTVVFLVVGGRSTPISGPALESKVRTMTDAQARKATIVVVADGVIVREAPASSYRDFVLKADRARVLSTVRDAIPLIEEYRADNVPRGAHDPDAAQSTTDSGYTGMTIATLSVYDVTLPQEHVVLVRASRRSYCVQSTSYGQTAFKNGPSAKVALGHC
jgi:Tfp pilus assembly protein PilE